MPSPNNVLTADSYIQDGLVFQLDGIDYGGVDGQWIDRLQQIPFIATRPVEHDNGAFVFRENTSFVADRIVDNRRNLQIECVVRAERASQKIVAYISSQKMFWYNQYDLLFRSASTYRARWTPFEPVITISSYLQNVVMNGIKKPTVDVGVPTITAATSRLGFISSTFKSFVGKLYAIRIYSRQLSDREILINQKIDNARFGLGLDIPDEVLPATRSLSLLEPFELPDESESEQEPTNDNSDER